MEEAARELPVGQHRRPEDVRGSGEMSIQRLPPGPLDRALTSASAWHFLFLDTGGGTVTMDRRPLTVEAGHLLCVPPATVCQLSLAAGAGAILLSVDEIAFRTRVLTLLPGNQDRTSSFWRAYYRARILAHSTGAENRAQRLATGAELDAMARHLGKGGDPAVVGTAL